MRPRSSFAQGGDLILKCIDGKAFEVHSVILSIASPVFADMLEVGSLSAGATVELAESSEMVDLMLKFIYPRQSPTITSFDTLHKALHIAEKYELEDMYGRLRREMLQPGSPTSLYTDPLGALSVACTHGLKAEARIAVAVSQGHYDFTRVSHLKMLAKNAPASIPWVMLIGVPAVKCSILSEVLFNFNEKPMKVLQSDLVLCQMCRDFLNQTSSDSHYSPPEWEARWAQGLSRELKQRPMDDWKSLFEVPFLFEAVGRHGGTPIRTPQGNCACLDAFSKKEVGLPGFLQWSSKVYDCLVSRLAGLRELEGLIR
ncbi:hypothetical protein FRC11_011447 [Ceratobasidium sp. 423]|nr:hypothetical protein FRC11_011447 [Ceratobasidium sp. 423]